MPRLSIKLSGHPTIKRNVINKRKIRVYVQTIEIAVLIELLIEPRIQNSILNFHFEDFLVFSQLFRST